MSETRRCSLCARDLELREHFYFRGETHTGRPIYEYRCNDCRTKYHKALMRRMRRVYNEQRKAYRREMMLHHPDIDKAWREKEAARMRAYRAKKREDPPSC